MEIEQLSDFEIVVKKKGQITIPVKIRKKYKIDEGTRLKVVTKEDGVLLTPKKTFWDMVGAFPIDPATKAKMDKELYDYRHEEDDDLKSKNRHKLKNN